MDDTKCRLLKAELTGSSDTPVVSIERFFDGNDDLGSIGCNLMEHPGIDAFRDVLTGLTRRSDVEAVHAMISEIDPGEDSWPFTDTILVVGTISSEDLRELVSPLEPDEIGAAEEFGISPDIFEKHHSPVLAIWWD